jgi:hypothetical protein
MVKKEINKEIEKISQQAHIDNLKREKSNYLNNIDEHEKLLVRLAKEEASLKTRYEIMLKPENFKIIKPVWQYELDPEYVETLRVEIENRKLSDDQMIIQNRDQITKTIERQKEALSSVEDELKRLGAE